MIVLHARSTDGYMSMLCAYANDGCEDPTCVCYCHRSDITGTGQPISSPTPVEDLGPTATEKTIKIEWNSEIN